MPEVGPLIASGRDADIFAYGGALVLRRSTNGRSLAAEARVMEHVAGLGYPVPRVHEVRAGGTEIVMDRVDGPSMLDAITRRPWTLWRHGATLAELHRRLHELAAPAWLAAFPAAPGGVIGHLDLHPMNILLSPRGPVVIDWSNAAATRPAADVALTWILMAAGQVQGGAARALLVRAARQRLVNAFLAPFDRDEVAGELAGVVEWKLRDPHMSSEEIALARALVARLER